jgi:recombination protein RecT
MSTQQIVKVGNNLAGFADYLNTKKASIAAVCARHMDPDRICRIVLNCVTRTPQLRNCTTVSIFRSVMQAAELGLEPGSALGEGYLVPYKDVCQFQPGYRGLVTLARRSGEIANIWTEVVYEGDQFTPTYGLHPDLVHIPAFLTQDPAKVTFAYACARFRTGETQFAVMPRIEIDRIRNRAASKGGPWSTDYAEMAKKTAVKRLCKMLPMSIEMSKAIKLDNAFETGDYSDVEFDAVEAIPDPAETPAQTVEEPAQGVSGVKERMKAEAAAKAAAEASEPAPTPPPPADDIPLPVAWTRIYQHSGLMQSVTEQARVESILLGRVVNPDRELSDDDAQKLIDELPAYLETLSAPVTPEKAEKAKPKEAPAATGNGMFD